MWLKQQKHFLTVWKLGVWDKGVSMIGFWRELSSWPASGHFLAVSFLWPFLGACIERERRTTKSGFRSTPSYHKGPTLWHHLNRIRPGVPSPNSVSWGVGIQHSMSVVGHSFVHSTQYQGRKSHVLCSCPLIPCEGSWRKGERGMDSQFILEVENRFLK